MSFLLLCLDGSGDVRALSPQLFESRNDAIAEVSKLAADPTFDDSIAEVFVIDFESAMPVLLVKPAAPAPQDAAAGEAARDEPVLAEAGVAESAAADAEGPTLGESAAVFEAPAEPLVEPVADEAIADAITDEAESADASSLREALQRTTAHMESTGIVAPESVGPEPAVAESAPVEPEVAEAAPEAPAEAVAEAPSPEAPVAEESPAWPWDLAPAEEGSPVADASDAPQPIEPLDLSGLEEPAPDDSSVLLGLQPDAAVEASRPVILGAYDEYPTETAQPTPAEEPLAATEATPPATAPVGVAEPMSVSGEPAGSAAAPESVIDYEAAIAAVFESQNAPAAPPESEAPDLVPPSVSAPAGAETGTPDAISDFILDLGGVTTLPEAEGVSAPATEPVATDPSAGLSGLTASEAGTEPEYTCEDCVYVETCPNKGQRPPKECVSFQWK